MQFLIRCTTFAIAVSLWFAAAAQSQQPLHGPAYPGHMKQRGPAFRGTSYGGLSLLDADGEHGSCPCNGSSKEEADEPAEDNDCAAEDDADQAWKLFPETCNGTTIGGWISAGIYGNQYGPGSNAPVAFRNVGDGFTVNQVWLYAEKAVDTQGCGWDWGYRVDYVFGVDGPDTQAFGGVGFDNPWDTSRDYGSALPQLYAEFGYNDWSVKLGHFFTIIGYEVVAATGNFFTSYAYTMNYGEPFTHTGALATYNYSDDVTFYGGWTFGWDTGFEEAASGGGSTFLGGVSVEICDKTTVTWATSFGELSNVAGDVYMNSFVVQHELNDRWSYVFQHDLGVNHVLGPDNEWYGVNQYLFYKINDCWKIGARYEWFRDDDGTRVIAGNAGSYSATTIGLNWTPTYNLTVRPELRYDNYDGTIGGGRPFDEGRRNHQLAGGFDVILTF